MSYDKGKTHRCDKRKYSVAVFIVLILNHMSLGKKETLICFRLVLRKFTSIVISKRFGGCMERNNLRQEIFLSGVRGGITMEIKICFLADGWELYYFFSFCPSR